MLTILIPMSGDNNFVGDEYDFPKPLIDIQGYPMIEWVIKNFESIVDKKFIFIVNESNCRNYHLDSVLKLLAGEDSVIIKVDQSTQGAACNPSDLIFNAKRSFESRSRYISNNR